MSESIPFHTWDKQKKRLENIQKSLKGNGMAKVDLRGKHKNRVHKLSDETTDKICNHKKSFKWRTSHYSLNRTKKVYLPEEVSIKKMHSLYIDLHPNNKISYETYRAIFNTKFNISFGYPRKDTCSTCDECTIVIKGFRLELIRTVEEQKKNELEEKIRKCETENKVHRMKAETFYERKRRARQRSRKSKDSEAISIVIIIIFSTASYYPFGLYA